MPLYKMSALEARHLSLWFACSLVILIALPLPADANDYSPPGFYDVEPVRLDNGMQVLLKEWGNARAASLRLVVGAGTQDLPCADAQIPHLLEHVVFEGTEAFPEGGELDGFVESRGGYTNATTDLYETVYKIDIYGPETPAAVDALYQMADAALLRHEAVEGEKAVVHRELGSDASSLRRWLYGRGIGQSGRDKAREALGLECPGMARVDDVSREHLLEFYRQYYVAANMTLVVVGQFDREAVLKQIRETFGTMPNVEPPARQRHAVAERAGPITVASALAPVLGSEATVDLVFPTAGYLSDDYPVLVVIGEHLDGVLYDRLRREAGLSYSPYTGWVAFPERGYFYLSADAAPGRLDDAAKLIQSELARLARHGVDAERLEELKRGLLLGYARGVETNAQVADYYVNSLGEFEAHGRLLNHEDRIEAVTAQRVQEVAARLFRPANAITALNAPTLGYGQGLLFGAAVLLLGAVLTGRSALRGMFGRRG